MCTKALLYSGGEFHWPLLYTQTHTQVNTPVLSLYICITPLGSQLQVVYHQTPSFTLLQKNISIQFHIDYPHIDYPTIRLSVTVFLGALAVEYALCI